MPTIPKNEGSCINQIMDEDLKDGDLKLIYEHMLDFGLSVLAHAYYHASCYSFENKHWSQLSVAQAAHAAEILVKARIAQEHPLLIFEQIPKPSSDSNRKLELQDLFENGRTYQYQDLPERLWATTGIHLPNAPLYKSFGKLRNTIQHFTFPKGRNLGEETLKFIFGVIDPFINECWGLCAVDYNEDHEPYAYSMPNLISMGIEFTVSKEAAVDFAEGEASYQDIEWPKKKMAYKKKMLKRFEGARKE